MKLTTAKAKLNKLGTLNTNTTKVEFNGEDDTIVLDDKHEFSITLAHGTIEFTTFRNESEVKDFTVTDSTGYRMYPSNLTKAINLAS